MSSTPVRTGPRWLNRTVFGIALATLLSDFSHEMVTAVLPLYLAKVGLGAAALGVIESVADFLVSLSKLAGGCTGHLNRRKKPVTAFAYLVTATATSCIAFGQTLLFVTLCRCVAWVARGFRGPLRDHLLAQAVPATHFGRAYGLERAADMLGAVAGPLTATLLVWSGLPLGQLILLAFIPGALAAVGLFTLADERPPPSPPRADQSALERRTATSETAPQPTGRHRFPRSFWMFLVGVLLFGLGDFSRTFLVLITAGAIDPDGLPANTPPTQSATAFSAAVLLYTFHNLISAAAAFPAGQLGDRFGKRRILVAGYALGVITNLLLAYAGGHLSLIVAAIALSGVYIAVEETLEKAAVASMLPDPLRSLGFGILAAANALGDMTSSIYVGLLIDAGHARLAFTLAAGCGAAGVLWMLLASRTPQAHRPSPPYHPPT